MVFFCLENQFFLLPEKIKIFGNLPAKLDILFLNCLKKLKFFGNLPVEIEIFLTRIHDPQISNQIDAAVAILLLISLWHHRRSCFLSITEFLDLLYNFLCNYYLHYLVMILCLLSRLLSFYYLFSCCNSLTPYSIYPAFFAGRTHCPLALVICRAHSFPRKKFDKFRGEFGKFRGSPKNQRPEGHGAGGVLLYVKSNFNAVERWDMCNETFKESVWCEIRLKKSKMLVGVCYRVPDATEESDHGMYKLLERANKETSLIMGDFNYHVDWENSEGEKEHDRIFLDFIETSFMQQHVMEPTRGKNILDLVITSDENM